MPPEKPKRTARIAVLGWTAVGLVLIVCVTVPCWWMQHHAVIRLHNASGIVVESLLVESRDGMRVATQSPGRIEADQVKRVFLPCAGHCSYFLKVRFTDGREFTTEERHATTWRIGVETIRLVGAEYE